MNKNHRSRLRGEKANDDHEDIQDLIGDEVDSETAERIFERFMDSHLDNLPILAFSPGTKATYVRESRPLLYLAILAVAGTSHLPATVIRKLFKALQTRIAEDVLVKGHKSIEHVQVLQTACFWYKPASTFQKHTFYQLLNMAANMAIELGLGRPGSRNRLMSSDDQEPYLHWVLPNPDSIECRRAWLVCYYCCTW